jgi:hypothetical protein
MAARRCVASPAATHLRPAATDPPKKSSTPAHIMKNPEPAAADSGCRCEDPFHRLHLRAADTDLRSPPVSACRHGSGSQMQATKRCPAAAIASMQRRFADAWLRRAVAASVQWSKSSGTLIRRHPARASGRTKRDRLEHARERISLLTIAL